VSLNCSAWPRTWAALALLCVLLAAHCARADIADNAKPSPASTRIAIDAAPPLVPKPMPPPPPGSSGRSALDAQDYQRKNEGGYFTGLPLANYDSNTGVGFGVRGYYYYNGRRDEPLFGYTPYFYRVFLQLFATTGGLQFHWLDVDAPTVAGTPFRFRSQLILQRNTQQHYYGLGSRAMQPLSFTGSPRTYRHYDDYQAALDSADAIGQTRSRYDRYLLVQPMLLLSLQRSALNGLLWPLVGLGFSDTRADAGFDSNGPSIAPTRLQEDCRAQLIIGCSGGWNNFFRFGVAFDTRDYEPDPNRGVFIDGALDIGSRILGSRYQWARFMVSPRVYYDPLRRWIDLVLAARATFQVQSQSTPFFGMNFIPYTEDPRTGLGGLRTLRGYKQDRFVGPVMALLNAEVRWTFLRFQTAGQRFALIAVPSMDLGATYDRVSDMRLGGWKRSQGGALRISWNQATILTTEYAFSQEDSGFYVNFNHMF
jgi:Omp85 superfamily domain